jgi:hypothetical protein
LLTRCLYPQIMKYYCRCVGIHSLHPPPVHHLLGPLLGHHQPLLLPHQDERKVS